MSERINVPPLYGLVLAGGRSRRMGRDKAALAYHDGVPHVRRTADLLAEVCARVFVSCRKDQEGDPLLASLPESVGRIPDSFDIGGPLNGILSALSAHPDAAFLVAACDLPFLSAEALSVLVAGRDPSKSLTVFENPARENFIEPLCAIYEPAYAEQAHAVMNFGLSCPTKIGDALDAKRLVLRGPEEALFLENANTPEDYEKTLAGLKASQVGGWEMGDGGERKNQESEKGDLGKKGVFPLPPTPYPHPALITVEYFAIFRAQAKRASEEVVLDGAPLIDLYERLRERHGFALSRESVHVAINDAYASWDAVLRPGDRLVFIPPVAGG